MRPGQDVDSNVSPLGYTGQYCDSVLGAYLLGNGYRFYSPALTRFPTPDDQGSFEAINSYTYCAANPINLVAPQGYGAGHVRTLASMSGMFGSSHVPMRAAAMASAGPAFGNGGTTSQSTSSSLSAVSAVGAAGGAPDSRLATHNGGGSGSQGSGGNALASPVVLAALGIAGLMLGIGGTAMLAQRYFGREEGGMKGAFQRWTHTWDTTSSTDRFLRKGDVFRLLGEAGLHLSQFHLSQTAPAPVSGVEHPHSRARAYSYTTKMNSSDGSADEGSTVDIALFDARSESIEQHSGLEPMTDLESALRVLTGLKL
jgi:RHS repeat-associated protein